MGDLARTVPYEAKLARTKKELLDFLFEHYSPRPRTFADLGGVWNVDGAYALYAADHPECVRGYLVDTHPNDRVRGYCERAGNLELVHGDFGSAEVVARLPRLDFVFFFDVLLHQVHPHWNEVLELYAAKTDVIMVYNQQWTGSVTTVRLLDLGREEYFRNTPHDPEHPTYRALFERMYEKHPDHDKIWRDVHHVWQWGITDRDLVDTMAALGFGLKFYADYGPWGDLPAIENHGFIFKR